MFSSGAKIFGHVSHSTELVRMCLACQHFDFNSTDWISDNLHVISSWYLWTMGKEFIFPFSRCSWGRNTWRTSKNVCVGDYMHHVFLQLCCMQSYIGLALDILCLAMNLQQNSPYLWNIFFSTRSIRVLLELVRKWTQHLTKIDQEKSKIEQICIWNPSI